MRILVVSRHYPPPWHSGYDQLCADVVEALRSRGHHVEVATCPEPGAPVQDGVHRVLVPENTAPRGLLYRRRAANANARAFRRLVEAVSPQVIYAWNLLDLEPRILLDLPARLPLVFHLGGNWVTPHGGDPSGTLRALARPAARWLRAALARGDARRLDFSRASVSCEALRQELIALGLPLRDALLCREGLPDDLLAYREAPPARRHLAYAGQISTIKGVETAIRALARLRRGIGQRDAELHVYGRGAPP